jgi:hypothetical protein
MDSIDFLEYGGNGLTLRHQGELVPLPSPRDQNYQVVLHALYLGHVKGTPEGIPEWQRRLVFDRWCAAWDLPDFQAARRLAYLVDHYRPEIANDLQVYAHLDLGELWRARRWTLLLDVIDRLPAHSWYAATVSMDEEHAKMMADAMAAREATEGVKEPKGPSLTTWTPEVAALTSVLDAVRQVQHAIVAVNSPKGKTPEPPKPAPRPVTPLEKAMKVNEYNRRKAAHESLVARMLPHKRRTEPPVH